MKRRPFATWLLVTAFLLALAAIVVVKRLRGPLIDIEDTNQYEFCGFYLREHLRFVPWPKMVFDTNELFYPYGTSAAIQSWVLERDYFYALMSSWAPSLPWLQIHFLLSWATAALGTAALLRRDFGFVRATLAGFVAGFANFYALQKYPLHVNLTVTHWVQIGVVTDFVVLRRAWFKEGPLAHLILFRAALLFLTLGLELGYVAGLSFTSFTLTAPVLLFVLYKTQRLSLARLREGVSELASSPWSTCASLLLLGVGAFFYLPLVLQIAHAAKAMGDVPSGGTWWAYPLRFVLPWLPWVHPGSRPARLLFGRPEGVGEGSPGWFFVIIAVWGVVSAVKKREVLPLVPLLAFLLLALPFHPESFPTLKIFPWFAFNRVGGRTTLVYPIVCTLFALSIPVQSWHTRRRAVRALVALGVAETLTAYAVHYQTFTPANIPETFGPFMATVRATPGEAVLDWPFCVAGGNGIGSREMCPYYFRNSTVFSYLRFHGKKVLGEYQGRLSAEQIAPYVNAGFPALFDPEEPGFPNAKRQRRCFSESEWTFFRTFVAANDFAGVNVYPDLLPPGCAEAIYQRLGRPIATTTLPGAGAVAFVPKPEEMRNEVDPNRGIRLIYVPPTDPNDPLSSDISK